MKTMTVKDRTYEKLSSIKREGESFSDLFDRLADKEKTSISEFAGFLSKTEAYKMKKTIEAHRKKSLKFDLERKRRLDKLWQS